MNDPMIFQTRIGKSSTAKLAAPSGYFSQGIKVMKETMAKEAEVGGRVHEEER